MIEIAQQFLLSSVPSADWISQVWCKSTLSYPVNPHLSIESITDMLIKAPGVAQQVPFVWNFIDKPVDGQIFLVWLSPESNMNPPSDGLQYMDSENCYRVDIGGNTVEIFEHKYGFHPATESHTSRIRRRFRLIKGGNDQLWLIYYLRSNENDRLLANSQTAIPQPPRSYPLPYIQNKPFMLYENAIQTSRSYSSSSNVLTRPMMYYNNSPSTKGSQNFQKNQYSNQSGELHSNSTYTIQSNVSYDSRKKQKTNSSTSIDYGSSNTENSLSTQSKAAPETEEPQGDELDFLTPRDISIARYMRHHDWIEEIFNSTFKIDDILSSPLFPNSPDFTIDALKEKLSNTEIQIMKDLHKKRIEKIKFSEEAVWLNDAINELNNAKNMEEIASITKTVEENLKKKSVQRVLVKKIHIKKTDKRPETQEMLKV
ncbi:uncharacterized protein T551_01675 [Pneumocystis jirovecii RU7]|uniref:Uncharacterized protein n=1 Tax=Pneumocystis jirovecii (strain RU7) TaxID=1408657 RepID=A0A0W4ZPU6_PNEJ7|nr:uncharacterized protein T551_01675 [Pneumocystis jirovecii RU7]KTW30392.1 hypothetical protein T551_01675 [Pneumocystis jirovecii RU7]